MSKHTDYVTWQRRAHALLGKLLDRCGTEGLPVIHWAVGTIATLAGECLDNDAAKRRAQFEAWAEALQLERRPERTRDGTTRLTAVGDVDRVGVVITADIYDEG
jgi:hypothetical protein